MLPSLEDLWLAHNQVTNSGCAALLAALSSGAMPSLKRIALAYTQASDAARAAVDEALAGRIRNGS